MVDITTIGEVLTDLTQQDAGADGTIRFSANPGGAPANLAVAASRLGAKTAFIGKVGTDSFGRYLTDCLAKNRVNTDGVIADSSALTTLAVVSLDSAGERSFSFYRSPGADTLLTEQEIPMRLLEHTRILHFGSVSLSAEPSKEATLYAVRTAKKLGKLISYDPNYRAPLWSDEKKAVEQMSAPLSLVDIIKVSEEELPLLTGTDDPALGSERLSEKGIPLVLVTLGADGAFYRFGPHTGLIPGVPCVVADTNGAGDTFFGAFLSRICRLPSLRALSVSDLEAAVAFANKAAGITTSRHGAIPAMPVLDEVTGAD